MLRVLSPTFKPVNNLICCKTGLMWVVKRPTSLFNSFCSNVARQVARLFLPIFRTLSLGCYINLSLLIFFLLVTKYKNNAFEHPAGDHAKWQDFVVAHGDKQLNSRTGFQYNRHPDMLLLGRKSHVNSAKMPLLLFKGCKS